MLNLLDEGLETFLRTEVPLPRTGIDVSFAAPDRDWGAGVTRPTVNLFLWDVRRNLSEREAGLPLTSERGRRVRRPPLPRVDCRYLVSAWTSETPDEHALLGAVLASLLSHDEIAAEHLPDSYAAVRPLPSLSLGAVDGDDQSDFWSAVGGQLKPGLDLRITATVDAMALAAAGPPVLHYEIAVQGSAGQANAPRSARHFVAGSDDRPEAVGAGVNSPRGSSLVSPTGTFLVAADPGDAVTVDSDPPRKAKVGRSGRLPTGGRKR